MIKESLILISFIISATSYVLNQIYSKSNPANMFNLEVYAGVTCTVQATWNTTHEIQIFVYDY